MKDYEQYPDGGVYWAKVKLDQQEDGVLFTSPVDGATHLVEGITIETFKGEWRIGNFLSEILDAVSEMGGGRWVMGDFTTYDYYKEGDNDYLEITEKGRQQEEEDND